MEVNRELFKKLYVASIKYEIPYLENVSEMVLNLSPEDFSRFEAKMIRVFEDAGVTKERIGGKRGKRGGGKFDNIIRFIAALLLILAVVGEGLLYEECKPGGYLWDSQDVIDCKLRNTASKLAYEKTSSEMEACRSSGWFDSASETAANKGRCLRNDSREKELIREAAEAKLAAARDADDDDMIRRAQNTLKATELDAKTAREKADTATAEAAEAAAKALSNAQLKKLTLENQLTEADVEMVKETVIVTRAETAVIVQRKGLEADNERRKRKLANRVELNDDIQYYGSFAALFLGLYLVGDKIYARGVAAGQQLVPTPAIAAPLASAIASAPAPAAPAAPGLGAPAPGLGAPGLAPAPPAAPGLGAPPAPRVVLAANRDTPGMFPQLPNVPRNTILPGYGAILIRNPEPITYPELLTNMQLAQVTNVEQAYAASQSQYRLYTPNPLGGSPLQLTNVGELLDAFTNRVQVGIRWTDDPDPTRGGRKTKINKKKRRTRKR